MSDTEDRNTITDELMAKMPGANYRLIAEMLTALSIPHRLVSEDGKTFVVTRDYDPCRINFEVEAGRVVSARRG